MGEWEKVCVESGLLLLKLKTHVKTNIASKVIMFEKCLEFKKIVLLFYGKQKMVTL
jgi:hypothetical protein